MVARVYPDGDLRVNVEGKTWTFNPLCVTLAPRTTPFASPPTSDHDNNNRATDQQQDQQQQQQENEMGSTTAHPTTGNGEGMLISFWPVLTRRIIED